MHLETVLEAPRLYEAPPQYADIAHPPLVGLTGKRNVGKTTVAKVFEGLGFTRIHAFDAGKVAAKTYFAYVTGSHQKAHDMVWGDLKDVPCSDLPGGSPPRYFLERFGRFMGVDMGVDWTLAMEIQVARRSRPSVPIVVESLIYEADWFKSRGGRVVRLVRPGFENPVACESDEAQAKIKEDYEIVANDLESLKREARWLGQDILGAGL